MRNSLKGIPRSFLEKWQRIADLLARVIDVPAALIMKTENEFMEVLISGNSQNNPYQPGDKEHWYGLYCETVIKTQEDLLIPNALKDEKWANNPDVKLGMIAYLGIPINLPDKKPFGTICVLDNKENSFSNEYKELLFQFKDVIELDLALIQSLKLSKENEDVDIIQKLVEQNDELQQINKLLNDEKERVVVSEQYFRMLIEHAPYAIFIQTDRKFKFVNDAAVKLYGAKSAAELINTSVFDRVHPDSKEIVKQRIITLNNQKRTALNKTYKHLKIDNTPIDVEVSAVPFKYDDQDGALVFVHDITEQKKLIDSTQKAYELIKNLAAQVPGVLYQYRLFPDGTSCFPFSSEGMYDIYEVTSEEVREDASPVFSRIHPDDFDYIVETINESARNQTVYNSKFRVILPKQGLRWRLCNAQPELLEDGSTLWHGIIMDITEEKIKEELLKEKNEELIIAKEKAEKANQLKTEFLNNMSHEIRTPMNGIIGFSKLLVEPDITEEKREVYAKIIQNSSLQLLKIIDDILEISILETKQYKMHEEQFYLNDLLMELFAIFSLKTKERNIPLYIKNELNDRESKIISDKTKLNKILGNLLENALKFTNDGFIEMGYHINANNIVLYVKDTGIGISPHNHNLIFERFSQEDTDVSFKHGGLGLGLSIAKENANLLGGEISLESEKGKGSAFFVTIPYKPAEEALHAMHNINTKNDGMYSTVLIVEDEEVNYLYLETIFQLEKTTNYKLIHAKNGKEAVDLCLANKQINLVLMDLKMPVMSGFEAVKQIKASFPGLPVIAQTAYSSEADKQLAFEFGCDDFISKPINKSALFGLINKHLEISTA